jgi:hypothetical protein
MSLQRSLQTGLLIGTNLQTAALRQQVAQLQQLAIAQEQQQNEIQSWRQLAFEGHKLLDTAERELQRDPMGAVFSIRVAHLSLCRISDAIFPDLADKQALYANQQRAATLLAHGESLVPAEVAQGLHRLAWLHQVRSNLLQLEAWLEIEERVRGAAILFVPSPGFFRGILLFVGGNIMGSVIGAVLAAIAPPIGILAFLACNGITLLIADTVARNKLLEKCNARAQKAGGWVGSEMRPPAARMLVEQSRARLSSWSYRSTATTSADASAELAKVDAEIDQLRQAYFPQ